MKTTLSTHDVAHALHQDENANWSYAGALALAEYLEEYEESTGEELELDVVAIRCDFAQYDSLRAWANEYFVTGIHDDALSLDDDSNADEIDEAVRSYIQDNGQLIEFDGGVIVSSF